MTAKTSYYLPGPSAVLQSAVISEPHKDEGFHLLTGRRFKLSTPTLALETLEGKRVATTVPAGTTVKVVSGPTQGDRMVDVLWEGRVIVMFAIDVNERGTEITDREAEA